MNEEYGNQQTEELVVVYIVNVGVDINGLNIYHFLISDECESTWGECWGQQPAGNVKKSLLMPDDSNYIYIKELKTDLKLNLAQDNTCFSMQDCKDNIVALAYEDLSGYEEYPEPFRIVIHFGERLSDVEVKLAQRNITLNFI